jgi:hypothetical protein
MTKTNFQKFHQIIPFYPFLTPFVPHFYEKFQILVKF